MKTGMTILGLVTTCIMMFSIPKSLSAADSPADVDPLDVIRARQTLMIAVEQRMEPIDTYTVDDTVDAVLLHENADTIAVMLLALPHLFPADSDLYNPDADSPITLALPAIWQNFPGFYQLGENAAASATRLAESEDDPATLRAASLALRASCDACHAAYLLPYETPTVNEEDLEFDFDSLFDKDQ